MSLIFGDCCKPPKSSVPPQTRVTTHKPETPSCSTETNLMSPTISPGSNHLSSTTRVLGESLNRRRSCLYCYRPMCPSPVMKQNGRPAETSLPPQTKDFMPGSSCFSNGVSFRRSMTFYTVGGFCHLYLPMILLMRAGDIETNPGPEWIVSEAEFWKLSKQIGPSYYDDVGINLEIPFAELRSIMTEHLNNNSKALMAMFTRWRDKQPPGTDIRALLAERLERSDLGGLSGELLAGSLVPSKPSRPPETHTLSAESQIKPLSPELIERCAKDFKFKYRSTLCKIRADPLNPASLVEFKKLYTNLVLEAEDGTDKQSLDYNKLLDLKVNGEFPKRLMVQGEAGAGKTTFCAKIAWDWVEGRYFTDYVWVLIVPLREFKHHTIGQIAKSYLSRDNPATASQLSYHIRSNPDKVFIAFDGLDEFGGKFIQEDKDSSKPECHLSQSTDQMQLQSSQSSSDTLHSSIHASDTCESTTYSNEIELIDIIQSCRLDSCPVLVTTRPWKAAEVRSDDDLMKLYSFIHIEGFNRESLSDYIHKYFPNDEAKANHLIQFTQDNDVISDHMAHYPIYVAMLCLMWKECKEQELVEVKSLQTFSQIFKKMFGFLKEHYAQKKIKKAVGKPLSVYLKEINKLLKPIAELALTGLLENNLTFSEDDFKKFPESMDTACNVGLLSQENRIIPDGDEHDEDTSHMASTVFFPHKLFQEYMAGVYLASLYESDCNEFNRLMEKVVLPRKEEFRYLLYFTVSRNKTIANHIMKCIVQDNTEMKKDMDLLVDVAFESQDQDVAALLRDKVSSEKIMLEIDHLTAHNAAGYLFTGIYEYADAFYVRFKECGPTMSHDVAKMICSAPSLQHVGLLFSVSFHNDFFAVLAKEGNKCKVHSVCLRDLKCLTEGSSQNLAEALCFMPELTNLELNTIFHQDLHMFALTLKAKASSTQGCFPQISKGNFRFNKAHQRNLDSFLCNLAKYSRIPRRYAVHPPSSVSQPVDLSQQQPMDDVEPSRPHICQKCCIIL